MTTAAATPPRDSTGQPIAYVDPAGSPASAGKFFAYAANGAGWRCIGAFTTEAAARAAVGLPVDRDPTADGRRGMAWWNSMSEQRRAEWLRRAGSARPADAWAEYKRSINENEET